MKVTPTFDRVIVRWLRQDTVEVNGTTFHVPAIAFDNAPYERGVVLAAGPGAHVNGHLRPMQLKAGDVVWFVRKGGAAQPIPYGDHKAGEVYMTSEENCLAILSELDVDTGLVTPTGDPALRVVGATGSDQLAEADAKVTAARQAHASARVALVDAAEEG